LEETILRLAGEGKAILLTTHMMGVAERLADHIFVIHNGRKLAYSDTKTLLKQFQIRDAVELKVEGHLSPSTQHEMQLAFPAVTAVSQNGHTHLTWPNPEQQQIAQLYTWLDAAGCTIQTVQRREADLEEVFLSLISENQTQRTPQ
jgi:ABC-2 type transport system ATP-binding protein